MTEPDAPYHRDALERAILGAGPTLTNEQVAAASGIDLADARRLWRALGFPDAGEHPAFTPADLDALTTVMGAVDSGAVDFDTAVRLTRALGQTMARLADWEVATLVPLVERLEVVVRFLAVLELYKQGLVDLDQPGAFGEIQIIWLGNNDRQADLAAVDAYDG